MHYFLIYKKISELLFLHLLTDSALCEHLTVILETKSECALIHPTRKKQIQYSSKRIKTQNMMQAFSN